MTNCMFLLCLFIIFVSQLFTCIMRCLFFNSISVLFVLILSIRAYGQLSIGGVPPGLVSEQSRQSIGIVSLDPPNYSALRMEDDSLGSFGVPERMGVILPVDVNTTNAGTWTDIDLDERIWRVNFKVKDAVGLALYFEDFYLAEGDRLFVYSEDRTHVIGAFTDLNNQDNMLFATEVVKGESIILEFVDYSSTEVESKFTVADVLVVYTPMAFAMDRRVVDNDKHSSLNDYYTDEESGSDRGGNGIVGDSDECEVNVSCLEGDNWRDQINGVVRIMIRNGQTAYWCTGSIMNNTALDFTPFILTADHCASSGGRYATPEDLSQWVFYFNYESVTCEDDSPYGTRSLTGAVKLASSTPLGNDGSDFYLLRLNDIIPNSYSPYFLGWNSLNELSTSGVCLHHPAGDVKKISTYDSPLEFSQWGDTPETHLMVRWAETPNGHGVTEGGSSGAPLFNSSKLIMGQLTGGESDCTNLMGNDYFGRIFYSWDKNGNHDSLRLKPWLDPINSGLRVLNGSYNTKVAIGQFVADQTVIPVGTFIKYSDLSINSPLTWQWHFEGGNPTTSDQQNPGEVYYDKLGTYDVLLVVSNDWGEDSVLLENYIKVVPVVYPNPTRNNVFVLFGNSDEEHSIRIFNTMGQQMAEFKVQGTEGQHEFSFLNYPAGLYMVGIKTGDQEEFHKILYTPR